MCAIGSSRELSVGAARPGSTLLGGTAIGASSTVRRAVMPKGGTLLTGGTSAAPGITPSPDLPIDRRPAYNLA